VGNPSKGRKSHPVALDEEFESATGKDMGKQGARVAQDHDKAVELSKLGMMDKALICLGFLPREKRQRMVGFGRLTANASTC
jgi:hypothetical protein